MKLHEGQYVSGSVDRCEQVLEYITFGHASHATLSHPAMMLLATSLVPVLLAATAVNAKPGSGVVVRRHLNAGSTGTASNFVRADRRRVDLLGKRDGNFSTGAPIANVAITYTVEVGIGSPPVNYSECPFSVLTM